MEMYKIIESFTSKQEYQCIVMATSYEDPLEDINLINIIEIELRESNISKGKIMFDLLTCFGDNSERFSTLFFDGYKFDLNSYNIVTIPKKSEIRKSVTTILNKLDTKLENTVLNATQIKLIRHGLTI